MDVHTRPTGPTPPVSEIQSSSEDRPAASAALDLPPAAPVVAGRASRRPLPSEWLLLSYLVAVSLVTVLGYYAGPRLVHALASTPDQVASAHLWPLLTSALVAEGPLVAQVLGTAALGVLAIRIAGGRVFWTAVLVGHVLGTLLVYAGVWIADVQDPSAVAALSAEADFGMSLVWCAALGVLAAVAWWRVRPLHWTLWCLGAVLSPAAIVVVTVFSDGLAQYEHIAAFVLAVAVVWVARRWEPVGRRLRLAGAR